MKEALSFGSAPTYVNTLGYWQQLQSSSCGFIRPRDGGTSTRKCLRGNSILNPSPHGVEEISRGFGPATTTAMPYSRREEEAVVVAYVLIGFHDSLVVGDRAVGLGKMSVSAKPCQARALPPALRGLSVPMTDVYSSTPWRKNRSKSSRVIVLGSYDVFLAR